MKKYFFFTLLLLIASNGVVFSQTSNKLSNDEISRVKFAIPLITYDTVGTFDNAAGEAYYLIVLNSFNETQTIPECSNMNLTAKDKTKIDAFIQQLNSLKQNPPTWDELFVMQKTYLIWYDKIARKKSKYKAN